MNDTELHWLGYERDELIGKKKIFDLLAPESIQRACDAFADFEVRGYLHDLEVNLVRKDGSTLPVLVSATAVRDLKGNYVMSGRFCMTLLSANGQKRNFAGCWKQLPMPWWR